MAQAPPGLDQFVASAQAPRAPAGDEALDASAPPPGLDQFIAPEVYGTPGQEALAGVEGAARGATLGLSDFLAPLYSTPKDVKARETENLGPSLTGNVLGSGALIGLTGGLAAPIEAGLGGGLAARTAGMAAEGALFGAGNAVSDKALGDPDLNSQKIMAHVGMGAALGGGLGILSKAIGAVPALLRTSEAVEPGVATAPIVDVPMKGVQPTNFEDMAARVKQATDYGGQNTEVPAKAILQDAASRVDMMNPVHPLQLESLDGQEARNLYNVARELPGKEGEAIRGYEALQKNELVSKAGNTIEELSPGAKPTSDAVEGGNRAIDAFTDQYQAEKNALKPAFKQLSEMSAGQNIDHLPGVVEKMTEAVPGVARMFDTESGALDKVLPYSTKWGIDRSTYNAVKDVVHGLEDNPESIEDLVNIRRGLDQHVDVTAQGPAAGQIRALKSSMMDYIQGRIDSLAADSPELRDVFRRYAINEQQRGVIEKVFGASVGSPEFGAISKVKPEMIGDRIFSNTANVKAAKSILEPQKFNEILSNWLSEAKASATDKGAFSSNKFNSFLRKNQDSLNEAFVNNPGGLQKLKDLTTMMRILPDSPSINPSGTAKTFLGRLEGHETTVGLLKALVGTAKDKFQRGQVRAEVAAALAGKADQAAKLKSVQGIANQVQKKITSGAKAVFDSPAAKGGGLSSATALSNDEFKKQTDRIKKLTGDPHALMDHLSGNTDALYNAAPNITQGIHNTMIAGLQFLNSKIPRPSDEMPLSMAWEPSRAQRFKFENYYRAVNEPLSVLDDVKNNSLTNESMEALSTVTPALLQEMRSEVMGQMKFDEVKKFPYASKLTISKFLGQPLDQNMTPAGIQANQQALALPAQSNQMASRGTGGKVTLGGMKELSKADRVSTETSPREDV